MALHAVACAVFAGMAAQERAPGGRDGACGKPTSVSTFAQHGKLRIPVGHVARLALHAASRETPLG